MPRKVQTAVPQDVKRGDGWIVPRVLKNGEQRYLARWREGSAIRSKTKRTRDEAADHLRSIGRAMRKGTYTPESSLTVDEIVADYLMRGRTRWTRNTQGSYALIAKWQISKYIGARRIVDLTPHAVQLWIDHLAELKYSPPVIENARTVLSGALKEAARLGIINHNPVLGAKVPARVRSEIQTWSIDQIQQILAATEGKMLIHAYYLVALMTGMRPGELRALMWEDIDFERLDRAGRPDPVIVVRRTITRDEHFRAIVGTETKTKASRDRVIAISPLLVNTLKALHQEQRIRQLAHPAWSEKVFVFDRGDGTFLARATLQKMHQRACRAAGVPCLRLHDLRHTYATIELENETDVIIVSRRMGHSSIAMTLDRYTHVSSLHQRKAASVMEARFLDRSKTGSG